MLGAGTMGMSALLIHLSHGMIEMHFHIFVGIAVVILLGDMWAVLAAAGTIAAHHILFWMLLPASVFNYKASFGIVLLHAVFVVAETIPACYIARKYGHARNTEAITAAQLPEAAQAVSAATETAGELNAKLKQCAEEQRASATQAVGAVEEIRVVASRNTEHSSKASAMIEELFVQRLAAAQAAAAKMLENMNAIDSSSAKIKGILSIIDQIAFQTNILALNAAVEAARAGAAGMGFGVVAEEVRALAQRCAAAARDTDQHIERSAADSREANERMRELDAHIEGIAERASQFRKVFDEIRDGSQAQNENISNVTRAHKQLDTAAAEIARVAQESSESGGTLREQAAILGEMIAALR
jgi:methyl-accepting chemotaxis protein